MTDEHLDQGLRVAESYLSAGNAEAALNGIREVLADDPDNPEALQLLVRALLQKNDANGAEDAADRLIAAAPEYDGGYRLKAAIMADRDKKSERKATRDYIDRGLPAQPRPSGEPRRAGADPGTCQ